MGGEGPSGDALQTIIISSALIFVAAVFGIASICAFVPAEVLVKWATKSGPISRAVLGLVRVVAALTKRDDTIYGRRRGKVAPEQLTDPEVKRAQRKRKKRIEEIGLASYTAGIAWCVDRALDAEGNAMYEQGLRLYMEPTKEEGDEEQNDDDDDEDDTPFVDMGRVTGAEAIEAFPGVVRFCREGKGNVALETCNFDPGMLEKSGIGSEPLWRDMNEKEWELCAAVGAFDRDMFGRPDVFHPDRSVTRQGFHPEILEILQLLTRALVLAVNGTVDEDVKMNCQDDFWVVDRLINVAGRPMIHKGVHVYLEGDDLQGRPPDNTDPDSSGGGGGGADDPDEMRRAGRVVSVVESKTRVGVIKIITADPSGELAVQSRKFRGSAIDPRGLTREPLWATMAPRWIDHGNKGERGGRAGAGLQPLPRVTAGELATVLTRTLAVDRQLESGAVDAEQWRQARGMDPAVRDVEAVMEEALDRLLYQRGKPEEHEEALRRAEEAEEAAKTQKTAELRIFIKEKQTEEEEEEEEADKAEESLTAEEGGGDGGGGSGGGGAAAVKARRKAAEGRGTVSVDHEGAARGEVRIDVNMGDRDTVYLHLDAEVLARMHSKCD